MKYTEIKKENFHTYVIEVINKSFEINITKELVQMKDIEPTVILGWVYDDIVKYLENEAIEGSNWKIEYNKHNSVIGWELVIPNLYESETLIEIVQ